MNLAHSILLSIIIAAATPSTGATAANLNHTTNMNEAETHVSESCEPVKFDEKSLERFWSKVDKNGPLPDQDNSHYKGLDRCWMWKAGCRNGHGNGYGQFWFSGSNVSSHRASWIAKYGPIPSDLFICHRCDNPQCVNPTHLFLGTSGDNVSDRQLKNRGAWSEGENHWTKHHPERIARGDRTAARKHPERVQRGESHYWNRHPENIPRGEKCGNVAKLTNESVLEIRLRCSSGESQRSLALAFNVSAATICRVVTRKCWTHI